MGGGISPRITPRDTPSGTNVNNNSINPDNNTTFFNSPRSSDHGSKPRRKKEIMQIDNPEISPRLTNYHGKFSMQSLANTSHNLKIFNNGISPEEGIFLTCDEQGNLCGFTTENDSDAFESWKVLYLDMKWPQQYFHLLNVERKRIVRAEMPRNSDDTAPKPTLTAQSSSSSTLQFTDNISSGKSQDGLHSTENQSQTQSIDNNNNNNNNNNKAKLITITIEDSENNPELRDTKLLFYLSRSQQHSSYYIINTTFGMCLSHDSKGVVSLQSVPEIDRSDCLWHFSESL